MGFYVANTYFLRHYVLLLLSDMEISWLSHHVLSFILDF